MKILNGQTFKKIIISGCNNLYNRYPYIDSLNVFPVPDGDTGTNMNLTFTSGHKEIQNLNSDNIGEISKAFSKGLLMGARGNSGVILSQIFKGLSLGMENKSEINIDELKHALTLGKTTAYKAVLKPVEGTILTVIREAVDAVNANTKITTIEELFDALLKEAQISLKHTPELLPVLKEVGVVDSGGAGLVEILIGFQSALNGKIIERSFATETEDEVKNIQMQIENEEFGYCTEFILRVGGKEKKVFNKRNFVNTLDKSGNSLVVVEDEDIVKVHIHTLFPGQILNYAQKFGEFVKLKIENMQEQHSEIIKKEEKQEIRMSKYGLIAVSIGDGINKMFNDLHIDKIVSGGQTMNPSTQDFLKAISEINAKTIYIFPNNSNIILAAKQASELTNDKQVIVIESKTIPQGLIACMMFNPEADSDENTQTMLEAISRVKSGQVTFAVRDTTIDSVDIKANNYIGIFDKHIVSSDEKIDQTCINLLESMIDEESIVVSIYYGENISLNEATKLADSIKKLYPPLEVEIFEGNQPVYSYIFGVE